MGVIDKCSDFGFWNIAVRNASFQRKGAKARGAKGAKKESSIRLRIEGKDEGGRRNGCGMMNDER